MSKYSKAKKRKIPEQKGSLIIGGKALEDDQLTDDQRKAADIFDKWYHSKKGKKNQVLRIGGSQGTGKALPDTTIVPSPTGPKIFKDLKEGSVIFGTNGKPTRVIGVYPQGVQDTYEITFTDGRKAKCNLEHLWPVKDEKGDITVLPLSNFIDDWKERDICIPMPMGVEFKTYCTDTLALLMGTACTLENSTEERIPNMAMYTSTRFRKTFLRGVLGKAGPCGIPTYRNTVTVKYAGLAFDLCYMARSIGYLCSIEPEDSGRYTLKFACPPDDGRLHIINIEKVEPCSQRCIYVDSEDHCFLTENFIPTHNTTLLRHILEKTGYSRSECYVMAYTGQAVNVLRNVGIYARTIHSAIMVPRDVPVVDKVTGEVVTRNGIPLMKVKFSPLSALPDKVKLLVIDEASFLPEKLEKILKRFEIPIFEIGDPIQLPPIKDRQVFTTDTLNFFMSEIMRQNQDNEIIDVSNRLRNHEKIDVTQYHDQVLFLRQQPTIEETFYRYLPFFKAADIVICCTNRQRQIITDLYREEVIHADSPFPLAGERLICRKNNPDIEFDGYMLTNGTQGTCVSTVGKSLVDKEAGLFFLTFRPDLTKDTTGHCLDGLPCDIDYLRRPFGEDNLTAYYRAGEKFEFAHAITCHLAQGAQYKTVLYMDSWSRDPDYLTRIRYTAITRATERVIYLLPYTRYPGGSSL